MKDRRRFARYSLSLPVRIRLLGVLPSSGWTHARTVNVSFEGLSVELRDTLEETAIIPYLEMDNVTIEIEIAFPHQSPNVRTMARTIWYDRRAPSSVRIGMLFERMDAEDRTRWECFIADHNRELT